MFINVLYFLFFQGMNTLHCLLESVGTIYFLVDSTIMNVSCNSFFFFFFLPKKYNVNKHMLMY